MQHDAHVQALVAHIIANELYQYCACGVGPLTVGDGVTQCNRCAAAVMAHNLRVLEKERSLADQADDFFDY